MVAVVRRWRWLFATVAIVTFAVSLLLLRQESDTYESTATYVVRSELGDQNELIKATRNLSGSAKINSTFAYVIESDLIEQRAMAVVESQGQDAGAFEVDAAVSPGTNILTVAISSLDADVAYEMAQAIGEETVGYVSEIDGVYDLTVLDSPTLPQRPLADWLNPVRLMAAAALAGGLALGAVYAAQALFPRGIRGRRSRESGPSTRLDDERYTSLRMEEEKSRTDDTGVPFTVAIMQVSVPSHGADRRGGDVREPDNADVPRIARAISPLMRQYDHLGHIATVSPGTFAAILPGFSNGDTDDLGIRLQEATEARMSKTYQDGIDVSVTSCTYDDHELRGDDEALRVAEKL